MDRDQELVVALQRCAREIGKPESVAPAMHEYEHWRRSLPAQERVHAASNHVVRKHLGNGNWTKSVLAAGFTLRDLGEPRVPDADTAWQIATAALNGRFDEVHVACERIRAAHNPRYVPIDV